MQNEFEAKLTESMNGLTFSSGEKERMISRLADSQAGAPKRKESVMKKWTLPKVAAIAAALITISGGAAYASGHITGASSSVSTEDYKYTYETMNDAYAEAGFTAVTPEAFSTGYTMEAAAVIKINGEDDEGRAIATWNSINISYTNAADEKVMLDAEQTVNVSPISNPPIETREINGITVDYYTGEAALLPLKYVRKSLPADIQERLDTDPTFYVGFGSVDEITYFDHDAVSFVKDDISYFFYANDRSITAEELFSMAEEIIAAE